MTEGFSDWAGLWMWIQNGGRGLLLRDYMTGVGGLWMWIHVEAEGYDRDSPTDVGFGCGFLWRQRVITEGFSD